MVTFYINTPISKAARRTKELNMEDWNKVIRIFKILKRH